MLLAEGVIAQHAAMRILGSVFRGATPEGRDFDQFLTEHHMHDLEPTADDESASEQTLDFFGGGVSRHIEILGLETQHQVAHGAANDKSFVARGLECLRDTHGIRRDIIGINAMLLRAERLWADGSTWVSAAEYAAYEFLNHRTAVVWASHGSSRARRDWRSDW